MKKKGLLFFVGCLLSLCACELRGVPSISSDPEEEETNSQNENNSNEEGNNNNVDYAQDDFGKNAVKLSFKSAASYEYLQTLNNKQVTINGYMATSSPVDGSFIFLMNNALSFTIFS